jgi:hypothetical protein
MILSNLIVSDFQLSNCCDIVCCIMYEILLVVLLELYMLVKGRIYHSLSIAMVIGLCFNCLVVIYTGNNTCALY